MSQHEGTTGAGPEKRQSGSRIAQLCDEDKRKIARMIEQLALITAENERLENLVSETRKEEASAWEAKLALLKEQNSTQAKKIEEMGAAHEALQTKYNRSLLLLRSYQNHVLALSAKAKVPNVVEMQEHERTQGAEVTGSNTGDEKASASVAANPIDNSSHELPETAPTVQEQQPAQMKVEEAMSQELHRQQSNSTLTQSAVERGDSEARSDGSTVQLPHATATNAERLNASSATPPAGISAAYLEPTDLHSQSLHADDGAAGVAETGASGPGLPEPGDAEANASSVVATKESAPRSVQPVTEVVDTATNTGDLANEAVVPGATNLAVSEVTKTAAFQDMSTQTDSSTIKDIAPSSRSRHFDGAPATARLPVDKLRRLQAKIETTAAGTDDGSAPSRAHKNYRPVTFSSRYFEAFSDSDDERFGGEGTGKPPVVLQQRPQPPKLFGQRPQGPHRHAHASGARPRAVMGNALSSRVMNLFELVECLERDDVENSTPQVQQPRAWTKSSRVAPSRTGSNESAGLGGQQLSPFVPVASRSRSQSLVVPSDQANFGEGLYPAGARPVDDSDSWDYSDDERGSVYSEEEAVSALAEMEGMLDDDDDDDDDDDVETGSENYLDNEGVANTRGRVRHGMPHHMPNRSLAHSRAHLQEEDTPTRLIRKYLPHLHGRSWRHPGVGAHP